MKSKKLFVLSGLFISLLVIWYSLWSKSPLHQALKLEWIENTFPQKVDDEDSLYTVLPYGYTLGPWPNSFRGEPIVTKLTYQKGPPQKFIQQMTQLWRPVEVELTLEGPKTPDANLDGSQWKECFQHTNRCLSSRKAMWGYAVQDLITRGKRPYTVTWFDSMDPMAARGIHFHLETDTYAIDRYTVITERGAAQNFTLKYVKSPVGYEASELFVKVMGSIKVKDDLSNSRDWIQTKIKNVQLSSVRNIADAKLRLTKLIQIQNWIFSLLSVDPTQVAPFFHLAGVTHLLTMDLLRTDKKYFDNQESWILSARPLLETLIQYAKDFDHSEEQVKNMEDLLQDVLLLQEKISTGNRK